MAGRKVTSSASYSLVKVVSKASFNGVCPTGSLLDRIEQHCPSLCAREFATGAGLLSDLDAIDGEVADLSRWPLGPGILALKDGAASIYFNLNVPGATPTDFAGWGVQPSERLLSTTLLQVPQTVLPGAAPVFSNYILAATQHRSHPVQGGDHSSGHATGVRRLAAASYCNRQEHLGAMHGGCLWLRPLVSRH